MVKLKWTVSYVIFVLQQPVFGLIESLLNMLVICIKCFYFQLAWKADFVLWQCFLCNMVPILLGTGHYLCRGRWGGGGCGAGRETRRKESRLFQITKIGGLNSLIKKFRGVVSSLIASYIFQILKYSFFSWFQSCTWPLSLNCSP